MALQPGSYRMIVTMSGFRQVTVRDLDLGVAKSYQVDVRLEIGELTQAVEIRAGAEIGLQTMDATVGGELNNDFMKTLPTMARCAASLMMLQPMVSPTRGMMGGMSVMYGGQVAGSTSDQTTFHLDGADATDLTADTNSYVASAVDYMGPVPVVPVPLESIPELLGLPANAPIPPGYGHSLSAHDCARHARLRRGYGRAARAADCGATTPGTFRTT